MRNRLLNAWYGPRHVEDRHLLAGEGTAWALTSGLATREDVAEAIRHAEDVFRLDLTEQAKQNGLETRTTARTIATAIEPADVYHISATGWHQVTFEIGWGSPVPSPEIGTSYEASIRISFHYQQTTVSWERSELTAGERTSQEAARVALDSLTKFQRRRTPPIRWIQLRWISAAVALGSLWLWAMLAARPALPVWLLSGLVVTAVAIGTWRTSNSPKTYMRSEPHYLGALRVDLTPRAQLLIDRANDNADWKVRLRTLGISVPITAAITAAIGAVLGKWFGT